jgi:phosphoglycolate phosphatase
MIKRFCEITGFKPSEVAMVGDNHHDMEEARNGGAGMAIAVLTGNSGHDDIAHLADHTFHSVAELPAFFRSL